MKQEAFFVLVEYIVYNFFVHLCTQCNSTQRLSFTTSKDRRTVRTWQRTGFAPDRTDFCSSTAVQTFAFIKDTTTHCFFFYVVIVAVNHRTLFFQFFFRELSLEFFANCIESISSFVFVFVA